MTSSKKSKTAKRAGAKPERTKASKPPKPEPIITPEDRAAPKDKKTGRTVSLEFAAEVIAVALTVTPIARSLRTADQVANFLYRIGKDEDRMKHFRNLCDQNLETAISLASLIAITEDELSNSTTNKKINFLYACLRFLFYEAPSLPSPRFDASRKNPAPKENNRLIAMVWEILENSPTVQAEISKQRKSGNLAGWKIKRQSLAIKNYSKIKKRLGQKFPQCRADLRRALIDDVKTSKKNSGAGNTDMRVPDAASGTSNAGN